LLGWTFDLSNFETIFFDGYGIEGHIIILVVSFAVALFLGIKNVLSKWLYPVYVACLVHFILPIVAFVVSFNMSLTYEFAYYLVLYGFVQVFMPHLRVALLGVVIGTLIQKIKNSSKGVQNYENNQN